MQKCLFQIATSPPWLSSLRPIAKNNFLASRGRPVTGQTVLVAGLDMLHMGSKVATSIQGLANKPGTVSHAEGRYKVGRGEFFMCTKPVIK